MSSGTRVLSRLLAICLLTTTVGCATMHWPLFGKPARKATARNPATQILGLWECNEGRDSNGIPCPGFAGQVLFLANGGVLPVTVDGDVRIYLFDNQGTVEEQAEPIHIINFDSGSWAKLYTYGPLGPAYNVFVPYTRKGVYNATCSLRIRFTPKKGPVIFSDMTNIELVAFKGAKSAKDVGKQIDDPRVEQTIPMDLASNSKLRKTTTIQMHPEGDPRNGPPALLPVGDRDNSVQLANYEVDSSKSTSGTARIAELEQMVQELREQANPLTPQSALREQATPQPWNDREEKPSRIRVRPVETTTNESTEFFDERQDERPSQPADLHLLESDSQSTTRSRQRHPLEDDNALQAPRSKSRSSISQDNWDSLPRTPNIRSKPHPLQDDDEERSIRTTTNPALGNHPLLDDSEDASRRAEKPSKPFGSKVIPASDPLPTSDRDPFEPIELDAGYSQTVEPRPLER